MDLLEIAVTLAAISVALVLAEWTYIVVWTRRFKGGIVSAILQNLANLRTGRGKNRTPLEQLADASASQGESSPGDVAPSPLVPQGGVSPDAILATPQAQSLLQKLAADSGLSVEQVTSMARDYLGGSEIALPAGARAGVPLAALPAGGAGPAPSQASPWGPLLKSFLDGKLSFADAAVALLPTLLPGGLSGAPAPQQTQPYGVSWW